MFIESCRPVFRNIPYPTDPQSTLNAVIHRDEKIEKRLIDYRHPDYEDNLALWEVYRDCYKGGKAFIEKYVHTFSMREEPLDFIARKQASYCPALSKAAVIATKNALTSRFNDIKRLGGPISYSQAVNGDKFGVDRLGSSMNTFMTKHVADDILAIGKVGIFIDKPTLPEKPSMLDTINKRPYLYMYKAEDILDWTLDDTAEPNQYETLLLRDNLMVKDKRYNLSVNWTCRYRYLTKLDNGTVKLQFFNKDNKQTDKDGQVIEKDYILNIPVIPFVIAEVNQSLLADIYSYQIAMVNMASGDVGYIMGMSFPFYTEQYDPAGEAGPLKSPALPEFLPQRDGVLPRNPGQQHNERAKEEIRIGTTTGRRYPLKTERPGFINPSPDPLFASMEKQGQLKNEIKEIVASTLSNITANSVPLDEQAEDSNTESGLFNVGVELENAERRISQIWGMYDESKDSAIINYPTSYLHKTDSMRRAEAKELNDLRSTVPSTDFQKEIAIQMADVLLDGKIPDSKMITIVGQIRSAKTMTSNADDISTDLQNGLVSDATASQARGYPADEVAQAQKDHAARIQRIQVAQQSVNGSNLTNPGARGVPDLSTDPNAAKGEKKLNSLDKGGLPDPNKVRGDGQ